MKFKMALVAINIAVLLAIGVYVLTRDEPEVRAKPTACDTRPSSIDCKVEKFESGAEIDKKIDDFESGAEIDKKIDDYFGP